VPLPELEERTHRPQRVAGLKLWVAFRPPQVVDTATGPMALRPRAGGPFVSRDTADRWCEGLMGVWVAVVMEDPEEGYDENDR
jgi:hypothetical protein